ncbi:MULTISPECIES: hypothetical protein [unclassified Methylobacterium]|uniref:hypothetical protein n=1 Tax=unclassified Methylobacterium TaxID=2615210 RepID=UPI0011CBA267|nr:MULTISPECIES: hypothetical protein [unclassified Methylobacterium]TXN42722.1 hypothetical protein FV233_21545 [Methylobacterium sp. WL7]TXN66340.1 hypothetical protein FV228_14930 [Methylobacterium sp. WL18]
MRILRSLFGGVLVLVSTAIVAFVSADRIAHLAPPAVVRAAQAEPSATGSLPLPVKAAPAPKAAVPSIPNGFDTERLNALMRGDPILPRR